MDLRLRGKRALVTGGSRGIGLATAKALAGEGCTVAIAARGEAALVEAARSIASGGRPVLTVVADARDDDQVRAAVEHVAGDLGGLDILVNAAATPGGGSPASPLQEVQDDEVRREIETKVLGYLRFARAVAPYMIHEGWGRIVNVSGLAARSASSIVGSMRNVAVAAMAKNLADQLGPLGINVTVVHPAMTETERTPGMVTAIAQRSGISEDEARTRLAAGISIGRLVTAAEIADVITFLCSPRAVAINGDAVVVGGGTLGPIYY